MEDLIQAALNFSEAEPGNQPSVVMLAERSGYDVFKWLAAQLPHAEEYEALWFEHKGKRLLVVAGKQIVTSEGLEVLGLATRAPIPDGLPAKEVLTRLQAEDAIPVLPWGVGKWLGTRGKHVDALIAAATPGQLWLGDNGGRPAWWPVPQFSGKLPVLAGSDPLPLPRSSRVIGRFGARIQARLPDAFPVTGLKQALRDPALKIATYGRPAPSTRFIFDQLRLRFASHRMEFA